MKKFLFVVSFLFAVLAGRTQNLTVEGTAPNLYITHIVAPKENFYSVGRLYNQGPKAIASFNNLAMEKGLAIGQHIKIPLNEQNFDAGGKSNSGETVALTHVVGKAETLSKISSDLNVSAQTIKQWNNLSSDNIAPGTPLIVGHLKMLSSGGVAKAAANSQQAAPKQEPVADTKETTSSAKKEQTTSDVKQEPVKQPEVASTSAPTKETPVKQEPTKEAPVRQTKTTDSYSYSTASNTSSIEGVFAGVFTADASQKTINNKSGEAATFKSTSGWQDKKYYILMNDVAPGTIVKIASAENKVVYAKVLGSMPEMKENNGLLLRISNAAASYLGIIDPRFPVQISYYQ